MGSVESPYAGIVSVCKECRDTVCRNCGTKSYTLDNDGICIYCTNDMNWESTAMGRYPETICKECESARIVNEEGLCRSCYAKTFKIARFKCAECQIDFEPNYAGEFLCITCKPECRGCGTKFDPEDRTNTLCSSCINVANTYNACRNCGVYEDLNSEAHCNACRYERTSKTGWCTICLETRVSPPVTVCGKCEKKGINCPECGTTVIQAKEYICSNCVEERRTYKYTAGPLRVRQRLNF